MAYLDKLSPCSMMCDAQSDGGDSMHSGAGVCIVAVTMMGSTAAAVGVNVFEGVGLGVGVDVYVAVILIARVISTSLVTSTSFIISS